MVYWVSNNSEKDENGKDKVTIMYAYDKKEILDENELIEFTKQRLKQRDEKAMLEERISYDYERCKDFRDFIQEYFSDVLDLSKLQNQEQGVDINA